MVARPKALSFDSAEELDARFPNTTYRYSIKDAKGSHELKLLLGGAAGITRYPGVPRITIQQGAASSGPFDSAHEMTVRWSAFETVAESREIQPLFAENTIFVLIDNGRGETVFTSGSGNKDERMSSLATELPVPAHILEPGMQYTVFVCFAADSLLGPRRDRRCGDVRRSRQLDRDRARVSNRGGCA